MAQVGLWYQWWVEQVEEDRKLAFEEAKKKGGIFVEEVKKVEEVRDSGDSDSDDEDDDFMNRFAKMSLKRK